VISLAIGVALVLALLSALHVYWSFGGSWGKSAAIPEHNGRPAFRPGRLGTLVVAVLLAAGSLLVLGRAGLGPAASLPSLSRVGAWGVAAGFGLRAMGDFRLVGLFRGEGTTRFARWDRRLYTPLALAIGVCTAIIAAR
jgi:hypothetical protein